MTPEQIAALRAAAEKANRKGHDSWDLFYFHDDATPATVIALLDHIAKLEAERDKFQQTAMDMTRERNALAANAGAIRPLKPAPTRAMPVARLGIGRARHRIYAVSLKHSTEYGRKTLVTGDYDLYPLCK